MTTICARIPGEGHSVSKTEDGSLLHAAIVFVGWLTCPWRDVFLGGGEVREACFVGSAAMWSQGRDRQDNVLAHGATGQSARANWYFFSPFLCWLFCFNQILKTLLVITASQAICLCKTAEAINMSWHTNGGGGGRAGGQRGDRAREPFSFNQAHPDRNCKCLGVGGGRAVWLKH